MSGQLADCCGELMRGTKARVSVWSGGGLVTVAVAGELDAGNAETFRLCLAKLATMAGRQSIVVDLSDVSSVAPVAARMLAEAKAQAAGAGTEVRVWGVCAPVKEAFEAAGVWPALADGATDTAP